MARSQKSALLNPPRDPLEGRPRTTASARVREVWDQRLRASERDLLIEIAGVRRASIEPTTKWSELRPEETMRIMIALRDLVQLGHEASYALGYSRRNG